MDVLQITCPAERMSFQDKQTNQMVYGCSLVAPGAKVFAKVSEDDYAKLPPGRFMALCDVMLEGNKTKFVGTVVRVDVAPASRGADPFKNPPAGGGKS